MKPLIKHSSLYEYFGNRMIMTTETVDRQWVWQLWCGFASCNTLTSVVFCSSPHAKEADLWMLESISPSKTHPVPWRRSGEKLFSGCSSLTGFSVSHHFNKAYVLRFFITFVFNYLVEMFLETVKQGLSLWGNLLI